jgi:hypothetical protein
MNPTTRKMLTMLVAAMLHPDADDEGIRAMVKRRGFTVSRGDVSALRQWLVKERRFYA